MSKAKEISQQFFTFLNKYKAALSIGIPVAIAIAVGVTFLVNRADNKTQMAWTKLWEVVRKETSPDNSKPGSADKSNLYINEYNDIINNIGSSKANAWALYQLGNTYYKAGNLDESLTTYKKFIQNHGGHYLTPFVMQSISYVYEGKGEYQKAIDQLKLIKSDVLPAQNNLDIGRCYEKLGLAQPAIDAYKKVLNVEADGNNQWIKLAQFRIDALK